MTVATVPLTDTFDQWRIKFNAVVTNQNAQIGDVVRGTLTTTATDIVPAINELDAAVGAIDISGKVDKAGDTMTGNLVLGTSVVLDVGDSGKITLNATSTIVNAADEILLDDDGVGPSQVPLDAHVDGTNDSVLGFDAGGNPEYVLKSTLIGTPVDMQEVIADDGVDYTAGDGGPDTFALPLDPGVISNVWVSFDGIDQFDGFSLSAAPDITFAAGIPANVDQVRIKVGSTTGTGVTDYVSLTDTPANYSGSAYKAVRVSGASNGLVHGGTGALLLDSGTTGQRPGSPVNGMIRYNSDNNEIEARENGAWSALAGADGANGQFSQEFVSSNTAIVQGAKTTFAHGLGGLPKLVQGVFVCTTAQFGYSVGDELSTHVQHISDASAVERASGMWAASDATNIEVVIGTTIPAFARQDTGAYATITLANWRYKIRAWA